MTTKITVQCPACRDVADRNTWGGTPGRTRSCPACGQYAAPPVVIRDAVCKEDPADVR
jgi:hypothetical protein